MRAALLLALLSLTALAQPPVDAVLGFDHGLRFGDAGVADFSLTPFALDATGTERRPAAACTTGEPVIGQNVLPTLGSPKATAAEKGREDLRATKVRVGVMLYYIRSVASCAADCPDAIH